MIFKNIRDLTLFGFAIAGLFVTSANPAFAGAITCGSAERTATLGDAVSCATSTGNTQGSDVLAAYPGIAWTGINERTSNGTSGVLTANLTTGTWGSSPIAGTWSIAPSFWASFNEAVLSMHVGNGGGDPDQWLWLVTPGTLSGIWSYEKLSGGGGGLSNLKLWGRGETGIPFIPVPEPSAIGLLGLGLLGLGLSRRRLRS